MSCVEGPRGALQEGQGKVQAEWQALHMPLLGSLGGVLLDSWAKSGLVNSNQKEQSCVKLYGNLI